jgi:predicted CXXCH cytochrome family protein
VKKMKKSLLVLGLALILVLGLMTGSAMAATNKHGSYATNTDACGGCHKTHTAAYTNLINVNAGTGKNDTYELCAYCHNATGESKYDVVDGRVEATTYYWAAPAGGFTNGLSAEGAITAIPTLDTKAITDKHDVDDTTALMNHTAPGGHASAQFALSCGNCHDPHGTGSYRTLQTTVNSFTVAGANDPVVVGTISATVTDVGNGKESITYSDTKMNDFCGACHKDYLATTAGSGDTNSGVYDTTKKRHRVGMLANGASGYDATKLVLPLGNSNVTCITCHYAHGYTTTSSYANGPTMLRMDERGVCQNCHNKSAKSTGPAAFVDRDPGAPVVTASLATDPTIVVVSFDSYMDKATVETIGNWTVSGQTIAAGGVTLQPDRKTVVIKTTASITTGAHTVTASTAVKDLNGKFPTVAVSTTFTK